MIHQEIRERVAELMQLDIATAGTGELAKLDAVTALAEGQYVQQLLSLHEFRPLVG
ncbi:MAG: hypothetical protein WAW17_02730 [Rhodococcus sp. (in: high G+C Gram-positive bacteria)]|uniref:hypothetical protein n=1 Tax=Rhodococcus sp. TaxID=1831 RepID=UPI003BB1C173